MLLVRVQRLQRATALIEKDDAARDAVGLPKPSFEELYEIRSLKEPSASKSDQILSGLGLASNPGGSLKKPEDR